MTHGHFYFLKQQYFDDYPDPYLMANKEQIGDELHNRPCFYAFEDDTFPGIFWLVPVSSRVEKYQRIYDKKVARYHYCDTIVIGNFLGNKTAFLIQNMCPATEEYISEEYLRDNIPAAIASNLESEIESKAKRALMLQRQGHKLIFPDVQTIEASLATKLQSRKDIESTEETHM